MPAAIVAGTKRTDLGARSGTRRGLISKLHAEDGIESALFGGERRGGAGPPYGTVSISALARTSDGNYLNCVAITLETASCVVRLRSEDGVILASVTPAGCLWSRAPNAHPIAAAPGLRVPVGLPHIFNNEGRLRSCASLHLTPPTRSPHSPCFFSHGQRRRPGAGL